MEVSNRDGWAAICCYSSGRGRTGFGFVGHDGSSEGRGIDWRPDRSGNGGFWGQPEGTDIDELARQGVSKRVDAVLVDSLPREVPVVCGAATEVTA